MAQELSLTTGQRTHRATMAPIAMKRELNGTMIATSHTTTISLTPVATTGTSLTREKEDITA